MEYQQVPGLLRQAELSQDQISNVIKDVTNTSAKNFNLWFGNREFVLCEDAFLHALTHQAEHLSAEIAKLRVIDQNMKMVSVGILNYEPTKVNTEIKVIVAAVTPTAAMP